MPIIEEIDEDEDFIDLVGMFEEAAQNWSLRMARVCEEEVNKSEVVLAKIADEAEEDDEEYKEDELFKR